MKNRLYALCYCVLMLFAAGCVRSIHPIYPDSAGVRLLPKNAVLASEDNTLVYKVRDLGGVYEFESGYAGGYKSGLFVKLDESHYVVQVLTENQGYFYALATKEGGSLTTYGFDAGEIVEREKLPVTKRLDDGSVQIEDRDQMRRFYMSAVGYLGEAQTVTYEILDYDNPLQRDAADRALRAYDEKQGAASGQKTAKAEEKPIPSSSGAWSLVQTSDPMTDAKITRIQGKPSNYEGVSDQPAMQVSCGANGLSFAVYWGAQMEDLYPDGEADAVAVDVRFDRNEPLRLGWAVSSDWTTTYNMNALASGLGQIGQSLMEAILPTQKVILAWDETAFHQNMKNASRVVLRGSTRGGRWAIMEFDMSGYSSLARAFPSHCG